MQATGRRDHSPVLVYVLLDNERQPLYVGSTLQLHARLATHRRLQPWWPEVAYVSWHPIRRGRFNRFEDEALVTADLCPRHNRVNARDRVMAVAAAERRAAILERAEANPDVKILRRPLAAWTQAVWSGTISRPLLKVSDAPVSQWEAA